MIDEVKTYKKWCHLWTTLCVDNMMDAGSTWHYKIRYQILQ